LEAGLRVGELGHGDGGFEKRKKSSRGGLSLCDEVEVLNFEAVEDVIGVMI
jgi:hypothetical protein